MTGRRFSIEPSGTGQLKLRGDLVFATATQALASGTLAMREASAWELDLGAIEDGDSAGIAVLVEWLSEARRRAASVVYTDIPPQMLAIARISGIEDLLLGR